MTFSPRLEVDWRVRFDECGADGRLRTSGFLRFAQETAWLHSEAAGFDRRWYLERDLVWLVRGVELRLSGPVEHGQRLRVSTEVAGGRRVLARRHSWFAATDGSPRAEALIDWVLIGPSGSPVRVPEEIASVFSATPLPGFAPIDLRLPRVPAEALAHELDVRGRDIDPMGHVNNAAYVDLAEEALLAAGAAEAVAAESRAWDLLFVRPAGPGEHLRGVAWRDGEAWLYRLESAAGEELFRARLNVRS